MLAPHALLLCAAFEADSGGVKTPETYAYDLMHVHVGMIVQPCVRVLTPEAASRRWVHERLSCIRMAGWMQ